MNNVITTNSARLWNRRDFLARNAMGIGSVALAWLLSEDRLIGTPPSVPRGPQSFDLKPKAPHFLAGMTSGQPNKSRGHISKVMSK